MSLGGRWAAAEPAASQLLPPNACGQRGTVQKGRRGKRWVKHQRHLLGLPEVWGAGLAPPRLCTEGPQPPNSVPTLRRCPKAGRRAPPHRPQRSATLQTKIAFLLQRNASRLPLARFACSSTAGRRQAGLQLTHQLVGRQKTQCGMEEPKQLLQPPQLLCSSHGLRWSKALLKSQVEKKALLVYGSQEQHQSEGKAAWQLAYRISDFTCTWVLS